MVVHVCVQRQVGLEKFDIALQKLDEDDAAEDQTQRLAAASLEHYNYSKVRPCLLPQSFKLLPSSPARGRGARQAVA